MSTTHRPCKLGHTERYANGNCIPCSKAYHATRHATKMAADPAYRADRIERNRKRRQSHPDEHRTYILKKLYNLTPEDYDRILALQGGNCALCGKPPQNGHRLHVDHCHATNEVRGLLHFSCNYALGRLGDTEEAILHVLDYLRNPVRLSR